MLFVSRRHRFRYQSIAVRIPRSAAFILLKRQQWLVQGLNPPQVTRFVIDVFMLYQLLYVFNNNNTETPDRSIHDNFTVTFLFLQTSPRHRCQPPRHRSNRLTEKHGLQTTDRAPVSFSSSIFLFTFFHCSTIVTHSYRLSRLNN